jgi:hypothetical protein
MAADLDHAGIDEKTAAVPHQPTPREAQLDTSKNLPIPTVS